MFHITKEQAKKLYKKYMRDHHGDRRARIGDRKCEFSIQTKPKQRPQRIKIMGKNELQQQSDQYKQNQSQGLRIPQNQQEAQGQFEQRKFVNQFQQKQYQGYPGYQQGKLFVNKQGNYLQQKKENEGNMGQMKEHQQGQWVSQLDYLTQLLENESGNVSNKQKEQLLKEMPQAMEMQKSAVEMDNAFWSGFITKSKKNRVGVDAHLIYGKDIAQSDYNLDINFRTTFQEVMKHKVNAVCLFMPSNSTQTQLFAEYKKYFQEKNRAGVAQTPRYMLYIIPTGVSEVEQVINLGNDGMIGVFTEPETSNENPQGETLADIAKKLNQKSLPAQPNYSYQQQPQEHENAELLEQELNDVLPMLDNPELLNILKSNMF